MEIDPLLKLLRLKARYTTSELADLLDLSEEEILKKVADYEASGVIRGYQAVVDADLAGCTDVAAFIEVKLRPERGGGFDRLAMRIARFEQVESCYLTSGGYDLMVLVIDSDLRKVASFVSEKLSTVDGIISCSTHFRLKTYKQNGFLFEVEEAPTRLPVSP